MSDEEGQHIDIVIQDDEDVHTEPLATPSSPLARPRKSKKVTRTSEPLLVPEAEEYEIEFEEIQKENKEGQAIRDSRAVDKVALATAEDTPIEILPESDHEFLGLVEEVPLEKKAKKKARGKVRKRPPRVDFDVAAEVIRLPRENAQFFGEGNFSEDFPSELNGILSEEDYVQSIRAVNEVVTNIPTLRTGILCVPPTVVVAVIMLFMILIPKTPSYMGLMIVFGFWCTFAVGAVIGFAVYYLYQREIIAIVAKEDIRLFHKGVRLAIKPEDKKALYIVLESGENRME